MNTDTPADTRLMGIIHEAVRRDLRRTREALTAVPPPADAQRQAMARHLLWMMAFLHAHHHTEDEGLYPMVLRRNAAAAALIERMNTDHLDIATDIERFEAAAAEYPRGGANDDRLRLLAALDALEASLLPHLRREEDDMMPLVSAAITDAELRRWEEEEDIKPKSLAQLGREGHWLLDSLGPVERDLVLHLVPAVPRFTLVHGFGRGYRRHVAACWDGTGHLRRRLQKQGRTQVVVDAELDAVWDVVRDPTRVGEWSHECLGATWLGGATSAVPGARFRGRNKQGIFRWGRVCEVVAGAPYEIVWRTVPTLRYPDSTEWRIRLEAAGGGTVIEQSFGVVKAPKLLEVVYATMIPAHRDRTEALTEDLRRLGALAASTAGQAQETVGLTSRRHEARDGGR